MKIEITKPIAKKECPTEYEKIVVALKKKGLDENTCSFSYDFCVRIDNTKHDTTSEASFVKSAGAKYGISLVAYVGRKSVSELINFLPNTFEQMLKNQYHELTTKENIEANRTTNLDGLLKKANRAGSVADNTPKSPAVMNGMDFVKHMMAMSKAVMPTYPTIEEFKTHEPQIYAQYLQKADGDHMVVYEPKHRTSDEWGMNIYKIVCAYVPVKLKEDKRIRILIEEDNNLNYNSCALATEEEISQNLNPRLKLWLSARGSEKAIAAADGTEFAGWQRRSYFKLANYEIKALFLNKICDGLELDVGGM